MTLARRILFVAFCLVCLIAVASAVEAIVHHGSTLDLWLTIVFNATFPFWIHEIGKLPMVEAERDEALARAELYRTILESASDLRQKAEPAPLAEPDPWPEHPTWADVQAEAHRFLEAGKRVA